MSPLVIVLIVLIVLIVVIVVAAVIGLVVWRRRRAKNRAPEATGPSSGSQLRAAWKPFYDALSLEARHFPTVVVMGEAGVGKTHAISHHVDYRGQARQFRPQAESSATLQLYLGPDVIVHELSGPILRDLGSSTKRALSGLWRRMGPSATVVFVLDARTLLTTSPGELRELAQLVRGKISLFPTRCREALDVRIYLSHLDEVKGYEEFAATLGTGHGALPLGVDVEQLLAAFEAQLTRALIGKTGAEFDRMVEFYATMPKLVAGLEPVLAAFADELEPGPAHHPSGLYLGALVPSSHVGDPFVVDRSLIKASVDSEHRRGLRGSIATAAALTALIGALTLWHRSAVLEADEAVREFDEIQDCDIRVSKVELDAKMRAVEAQQEMERTEHLWLGRTFQPSKEDIDRHFEYAIREHYLEPRLEQFTSRIDLLYVTSLIYASKDNELGELILANTVLWADALGIHKDVVKEYVKSSEEPYADEVLLPEADRIHDDATAWSNYLLTLGKYLLPYDATLSFEDVETLQTTRPPIRTSAEYDVLDQLYSTLQKDEDLGRRLERLLAQPLDSAWIRSNYAQLGQLSETIGRLDVRPERVEGSGLAKLVQRLEGSTRIPAREPYEIVNGDRSLLRSEALDAVIARSELHELLAATLEDIARRRPAGGTEFFASSSRWPAEGMVQGHNGRAREKLDGEYTKLAFETDVAPVLAFANTYLRDARVGFAPQPAGEASADPVAEEPAEEPGEEPGDPAASESTAAAPPGPAASQPLRLSHNDRMLLEDKIRTAINLYAVTYAQQLRAYYEGFEFDPGSEVSLPFALKPFAKPGSWFTDFLTTVSNNARLPLPADDPGEYFKPMREAFVEFEPLLTVLVDDAGTLPALEPYQELMAGLQQEVSVAIGESGDPTAPDLVGRLSTLGVLALGVSEGTTIDYEGQVHDWLSGEGLDIDWAEPFLAPVEAVNRYGRRDITEKVATAWSMEVRPVVTPVLDAYPFNPDAAFDASIVDLESTIRAQGEVPGEFWELFDLLIRPAMSEGQFRMVSGVRSPGSMLPMVRDLDRITKTLWNEDGERVPIEVEVRFEPLPAEPVGGRIASMAGLGAGGDTVYGFNQRPAPQTMSIEWWEQGSAIVSLTMTAPELEADVGQDLREGRYKIVESGEFAFYRLLDQGTSSALGGRAQTLSQVAMARGTRCGRGTRTLRNITVQWPVMIGRGGELRQVEVRLLSDPWGIFAVRRRCR